MSGYNPVMPDFMPGMGATAQNAAMAPVSAGAGNAASSGLSGQTQGLINNNINPITGAAIKPGFFGQGGMAQIGLGAISTLGSLWNSFQQNKIAKKSIQLQERTFETNLKNQTQSYNTELRDRIENRYRSEGRENYQQQADGYVDRNKL